MAVTVMRVRFNDEMMSILIRQQGGRSVRLAEQNEIGMEVQGEPSPGRINVRFRLDDTRPWSYRTLSARDLIPA